MRALGPTLPLLLVLYANAASGAPPRPDRPGDLLSLQERIQQVIERAEPSIACILVSRSDAYREFGSGPSGVPGQLGGFDSQRWLIDPSLDNGRQRQKILNLDLSHPETIPESYGSGVVMDESGLVLTTAHVVTRATKIYVRLPGQQGSWADIHALDPRSDLAVLRLLRRPPDLKAIPIGDGTHLRKGAFVVSLANPFAAGFRDGSPSASLGIVSNLRRRAPGLTSDIERSRGNIHHLGSLIQTDARLQLGCSGGALLNLQGEMVGLTTAIAAISGGETPGGFAVAIDTGIRRIIDVLKHGDEVEYGFLGVRLHPDREGGGPGRGVSLAEVPVGGPAWRAGLRATDVIVAVNDRPVRENDDLFLLVSTQLAGNEVRIEVIRPGQGRQVFPVRLAKFPVPGTPIASHRERPRLGLRVDYTSVIGLQSRSIPEGVVIRDVEPQSPADQAHLRPDTVIRRVNGRAVQSPAEFYQAVDHAAGPVELTYVSPDLKEERVLLGVRGR
jgi:S1-C subfamily serine protease